MKKFLPLVVVLACAVAFVFGVVELFKLRFETGDVYPEYSSLRSDPMGTMALYESLERLPGISVRRDFTTANRLPDGKQTTYLHLAASRYEWEYMPEELVHEIEQFLSRGGRLVISLLPEFSTASRRFRPDDEKEMESKEKEEANKKSGSPKKKSKNPEEEVFYKPVSLRDRWGVGFRVWPLSHTPLGSYEPARVVNESDLSLPAELPWHSGVIFTNLTDNWQIIYSRGSNAVLVERSFGRGSVVIATDSYLFSNEAMQKDRHPDLLAWLIGSGRTVYFDEAHLGVMQRSGVAVLMRQYRLHWLAAGLILLAGLFIWKNSMSLVPPQSERQRQEYVSGKDAAAGFVNLLRRSVPAREILSACFAEWKKSLAGGGKYSAARLQQAEAAFQVENSLGPRDRNPVRAYRNISKSLKAAHPTHSGGQLTTDN